MGNVLSLAVCCEFKDLQVVFLLNFHADDKVSENDLRKQGDYFANSLGAITWVVEHLCYLMFGFVMWFVGQKPRHREVTSR